MIEEQWEIAACSLLITLCMSFTILICIFGCKTKEQRDELVGIEGHVKMTNPEIVEHEPNGNILSDNERGAKRSLPDLPVGQVITDVAAADVSWEPNGDTTSELYATVGNQKKADVASPITPREHPYDKLKAIEHPYAQVNLAIDGPSTSQDAAPSSPQPVRDIPAANAIAGHVHASDDLPYMTPPAHFSGDSQDSAKGYTSISVREPLATIRAETIETKPEQQDRHYTTVSDDSDDMYAAIDEPASGSETYAQIRPAPLLVDTLRTATVPVHPPTHSRQESSSSAASSGPIHSPKPEKREANSPLPAPPERSLDDLYAKVNKKRRKEVDEVLERGNSTESAMSGSSESVSYRLQSNNISVTDSSHSHSCLGQSTTSGSSGSDASAPNSRELQLAAAAFNNSQTTSESQNDPSDSSLSSDPDTRASYERLNDDPRYETLTKKEPGYETLNKRNPNDPGYETLNNNGQLEESEPNYETLGKGPPSDSDPNYERIGRRADDGYATVNKKTNDPPYASLDSYPYATVVKNNREPPYATLDNDGFVPEPDYESVQYRGGAAEPPYQLLADFESSVVATRETVNKKAEDDAVL